MADSAHRAGMLRRLIDVAAHGPGRVVAWIEDDFHHFGVMLDHQAGVVTDVSAKTVRAPWTTCAAAAFPLRALVGKALLARASDIGRHIDMRLQCTHMFDLAGLALAHAYHARRHRIYEARVSDRPRYGATTATLLQDGAAVLQWDIEDTSIVGPASHAHQSLNEGFRAWTETLPIGEAEQAFVLRRAVMVSGGRLVDLDQFETAAGVVKGAACHTYQPQTRELGQRNKGSTRDYAAGSDAMLRNVGEIP